MASSTARALELLELLQSAGLRTVGELAERLGVDPRTVRRHVERLRELGIPVEAVRGRHGGYRVAAGYRMPPLMLTEDEALAVLTSLTAARSTAPAASADFAAETAMAKIRRGLPSSLATSIDDLLDVAVIGPQQDRPPVDPAILLTTAEAIRARRPLAMSYRSPEELSRRTIQPHDLVAYRGRWYLVALDARSGERRTFRLDRIRALRALRGTFPPPPAGDALATLVDDFARADYRFIVRLRILATAEQVVRHLPQSVAMLEKTADVEEGGRAWLRATIHAQALDWLPPVLLALDRPVLIDEPAELRALTASAADRLAQMSERPRQPSSCGQERERR